MIAVTMPVLVFATMTKATNSEDYLETLGNRVRYWCDQLTPLKLTHAPSKYRSWSQVCIAGRGMSEVTFYALNTYLNTRRQRYSEVYHSPIFVIVDDCIDRNEILEALTNTLHVGDDEQATVLEVDSITSDCKVWTLSANKFKAKTWVELPVSEDLNRLMEGLTQYG